MARDEASTVVRPLSKPLRLAIATLGAAVLIAAAIGVYFSIAPGTKSSFAAAVAGQKGFPFRLHAAPQALANITFADEAGRKLTLADFRGKVVLLNFWATWCPPCRKEMPTLDRLEKQLGGKDFEVVALSIDTGGMAVIKTFYAETGVSALRVYVDESMQAASALGVVGLPTTLLIDAQGREIGRKIGPAVWDSPEVIETIHGYLPAPSRHEAGGRNAGDRHITQ